MRNTLEMVNGDAANVGAQPDTTHLSQKINSTSVLDRATPETKASLVVATPLYTDRRESALEADGSGSRQAGIEGDELASDTDGVERATTPVAMRAIASEQTSGVGGCLIHVHVLCCRVPAA